MAFRQHIPNPPYYPPIRVERKTPRNNLLDYINPVANAMGTWQRGQLDSRMFDWKMQQAERDRAIEDAARIENQRRYNTELMMRQDALAEQKRLAAQRDQERQNQISAGIDMINARNWPKGGPGLEEIYPDAVEVDARDPIGDEYDASNYLSTMVPNEQLLAARAAVRAGMPVASVINIMNPPRPQSSHLTNLIRFATQQGLAGEAGEQRDANQRKAIVKLQDWAKGETGPFAQLMGNPDYGSYDPENRDPSTGLLEQYLRYRGFGGHTPLLTEEGVKINEAGGNVGPQHYIPMTGDQFDAARHDWIKHENYAKVKAAVDQWLMDNYEKLNSMDPANAEAIKKYITTVVTENLVGLRRGGPEQTFGHIYPQTGTNVAKQLQEGLDKGLGLKSRPNYKQISAQEKINILLDALNRQNQ